MKRIEREGLLNIQPLALRLPPHSSLSLKCAKGKVYNEKMLFAQMTIHDIYRIRTFAVEFLHRSKRSWRARE